jgi:hypothetical protein
MPHLEPQKDSINKSKLRANHIDHNCSIKQMKVKYHITHKKEEAINQNHKSQLHIRQRLERGKRRWNVINQNLNVAKMCTLFSKSLNNDSSMNMKKIVKRKSKKTLSLCLSQKRNQQSRGVCAALNQFFNSLLIFVSAISLQGNNSFKKLKGHFILKPFLIHYRFTVQER